MTLEEWRLAYGIGKPTELLNQLMNEWHKNGWTRKASDISVELFQCLRDLQTALNEEGR